MSKYQNKKKNARAARIEKNAHAKRAQLFFIVKYADLRRGLRSLMCNSPWATASASIPPVLVPPIQSNNFTIGCFVNSSKANSSWMRISPLMPPPSNVKTVSFPCSDLNIDSLWEPCAACPESTVSNPGLDWNSPADTKPAVILMTSW